MRKIYDFGFTLIELLVVVGILGVLLSMTIVAINPVRQFKSAHDGKRQNDVNSILNAVNQYASDNEGTLPAGITTTPQEIGIGAAGQVDLCPILIYTYTASIPTDPSKNIAPITKDSTGNCPTSYSTGYGVYSIAGTQRITVYSLTAELVPTITVTK